MSFDPQKLADSKFEQSELKRSEWLLTFESADLSLKQLNVDYQLLEHLAVASRTPEQFTIVARLIYQHAKSNRTGAIISEKILALVNRSPFSLGDWIGSVEYFHQWLVASGKKIDFSAMLEYLECCAASPEARKGRHTLIAVVQDMLDTHGYDAGK